MHTFLVALNSIPTLRMPSVKICTALLTEETTSRSDPDASKEESTTYTVITMHRTSLCTPTTTPISKQQQKTKTSTCKTSANARLEERDGGQQDAFTSRAMLGTLSSTIFTCTGTFTFTFTFTFHLSPFTFHLLHRKPCWEH
jgi:hypothetical protein